VAANRCYEGLWGHNTVTPAALEHWLPTLDTRGVFFLFGSDGALVGMVRATPQAADGRLVGMVDAPGVVAQWRSADLYRPLLLHALAWLTPQAPTDYRIESWGDDPAVIAAYQAVGFTITRRELIYRQRIADA
jgi:hypothetical protein